METLTNLNSSSGPVVILQDSNSLSWLPKWSWVLTALLVYPLIQQSLRYYRLRTMRKKYGYHTRQALAKMTDKEAWEIMNYVAELEFPRIFEKGESHVATIILLKGSFPF